ncbi:MAG TPA: hypothetical protein GX507_11245 [Clostridia bacterium]|nr:hypothetical protein [Clostridia bacterium]
MKREKPKKVPIRACVAGRWVVVGSLVADNPPTFIQKINSKDILGIRGSAGIDLRYDPPLPEDCVVRHIVDGVIYEISLRALKNHPKTCVARVGKIHPARMYLPYRYWRCLDEPEQPSLFGGFAS